MPEVGKILIKSEIAGEIIAQVQFLSHSQVSATPWNSIKKLIA